MDTTPGYSHDWETNPSPAADIYTRAQAQHNALENTAADDRARAITAVLEAHGITDTDALVTLIDSPEMLHALDFDQEWSYGSEWNRYDAGTEEQAHGRAGRDPEHHGGMVQMAWTRNHPWVLHDPAIEARALHRENVRRTAAHRRAEQIKDATAEAEAEYQATLAKLED